MVVAKFLRIGHGSKSSRREREPNAMEILGSMGCNELKTSCFVNIHPSLILVATTT
jgi:hypothetical protein